MSSSQDFEIKQGATFSLPIYWYAGDPIIKTITAIASGYPPTLTAVGHGLPTDKIPVQLAIKGPTELSTADGESVYALKLTADTFSLPDINAGVLSAVYAAPSYLIYKAPKDITGYTARMQLRSTVGSAAIIFTLTDSTGEIVIGTTDGKITLVLTATQTAALSFTTAVYQLELISGSVVTRVASGTITLNKEVTR